MNDEEMASAAFDLFEAARRGLGILAASDQETAAIWIMFNACCTDSLMQSCKESSAVPHADKYYSGLARALAAALTIIDKSRALADNPPTNGDAK